MIVPTSVVARDAVARLGIDGDRIAVIPEAAADAMTPRDEEEVAAARRRYGLPPEYLVWVGGLERPDPRKRVADMANTRRELPLVLVGRAGHWARQLPDVTLTGHVPDDDLAAIYSGARALVFPSDDEGFGLPPVEALACGTPVVACDVPALREVLDGRATFVEMGDFEGLLPPARRRPAPGAGAADVDVGGRRARDVEGLRGGRGYEARRGRQGTLLRQLRLHQASESAPAVAPAGPAPPLSPLLAVPRATPWDRHLPPLRRDRPLPPRSHPVRAIGLVLPPARPAPP